MALFQSTYGTASYVGIGATAPQTTLDVRGIALIGDYSASGVYNTRAALHLRKTGVTPHLMFENIGVKTGAIACSSAGLFYGTDGACDHVFRTAWTNSTDLSTSGTERFRIASNGVLSNTNNGVAGTWNTWYLRGTSLWGDGITTYTGAYTTAGTLYQTIGDYCMFSNPHITASFGGNAYIRMGRAGGVASGTWWDMATTTAGALQISREANAGLGCIYCTTGGAWGVNRTDPGYTFDVNGSFRVTSTSYFNTTMQLNFGGRAASALENQGSFLRWAHYDIRWYDWNGVGDFFYLQYGVGGIGGVDTNYKWYIGGVSRCYNGDGSSALYGPNATWGAYLWVGAGTSRIVSGQAQCITTNGNLHLDSGVGQAMYLNGYNAGFANAGGGVNSYGTFTNNGSIVATVNVTAQNASYSSNWFRSYGNGGLYFESWGGGWAMEDSTWVRCYNGKAIYATNTIATTGDVIAYYSDMRLKKNIKPIEDALDKLMGLSTFTYEANDLAESLGYRANERNVGFSAQEVKAILPEVIRLAPCDIGETNELTKITESRTGENYMTLLYERMLPLVVKALQEESTARRELETRVAALEKLLVKE